MTGGAHSRFCVALWNNPRRMPGERRRPLWTRRRPAMTRPGTRFTLEVTPTIPPRLARLAELADDLWYAWDRAARQPVCAPRSRSLADRRPQPQGAAASGRRKAPARSRGRPGLSHELQPRPVGVRHLPRASRGAPPTASVPTTWSPISAPNSASTKACPSTPAASASSPAITARRPATRGCRSSASGLLYRQGYFFQTIDGDGNQHATYQDSDFAALPIQPAHDDDGSEVHVAVDLPDRVVEVKVWQARVGHVRLYLLDTDLPVKQRSRPRHRPPPVRRGQDHAHRAGNRARHRRRARTRSDGPRAHRLAHQRRARGVPGPRARAAC